MQYVMFPFYLGLVSTECMFSGSFVCPFINIKRASDSLEWFITICSLLERLQTMILEGFIARSSGFEVIASHSNTLWHKARYTVLKIHTANIDKERTRTLISCALNSRPVVFNLYISFFLFPLFVFNFYYMGDFLAFSFSLLLVCEKVTEYACEHPKSQHRRQTRKKKFPTFK